MAKVSLQIKGGERVRAQFLAAGTMIKRGVLNVVGKFKIGKSDSQYLGDDIATAQIGSSDMFTIMAADIRGAYKQHLTKLADPAKAPVLFVNEKGEPVEDTDTAGYINPALDFAVNNGVLVVAV